MKIVIIGSTRFDCLEFHIKDSLEFLGHQVKIIDYSRNILGLNKHQYWVRRFSDHYNKYVFNRIADRTMDEDPDLIIVTYRDVNPSYVRRIRECLKSIPVVHFNPDQLTTLNNQEIFASKYDFYFSKDKYMVSFMRDKMALKAFYLPECFNPRFSQSDYNSKQAAEEAINIDVLVYGNFYPYRNNMVEYLIKQGINLKLCGIKGPYFPQTLSKDMFSPIYGKEKTNLILGSKIVFNNFHFAEINSVNEKYFVINGNGGFQICDHREVLDEYSPIASNLYSFKDISEATEKIKYFLSNSSKRYDIAKRQKDHFMQYHTYDKRMSEMLKLIFGN